jgi:hypothetical protein
MQPNRFSVGAIPMVASKGVVNVPALLAFWTREAAREKEEREKIK